MTCTYLCIVPFRVLIFFQKVILFPTISRMRNHETFIHDRPRALKSPDASKYGFGCCGLHAFMTSPKLLCSTNTTSTVVGARRIHDALRTVLVPNSILSAFSRHYCVQLVFSN
ncbi:hypothetical protein ARMGADRAFT_616093 [Armillaria gallica]|uniref:Uncharacterized protein n=1 Tax=Armillaria gallica TaxID=47427 RepID=A0A2H3D6R8_ARMGA|nr:hypothetical protein ARMGADRAFT_616093 [Armillaria gallica]